MASAISATRVMLPNAALKSLHSNCLCSLPLSTLQPGIRLSSLLISSSESFCAGIVHLLRSLLNPGRKFYHTSVNRRRTRGFGALRYYESGGAQDAIAGAGFGAPRALRFVCLSRLNPLSYKFPCALKFSSERRGCVIRRTSRNTETPVKKKIRVIQYGIGPIDASIAKLLREKQSIEICGAIDTDPAKVGRDLGEVVGASDAPWGVKISADAGDVLEQAADVVIHSTSSSLSKVMDQLLACLKAESCVVSTCEELSYPYRTHPELAAKLDAEAKDWGVALAGTGVNPGFAMDKLVVTLAAVSQP